LTNAFVNLENFMMKFKKKLTKMSTQRPTSKLKMIWLMMKLSLPEKVQLMIAIFLQFLQLTQLVLTKINLVAVSILTSIKFKKIIKNREILTHLQQLKVIKNQLMSTLKSLRAFHRNYMIF
jgi:hypothetical protein